VTFPFGNPTDRSPGAARRRLDLVCRATMVGPPAHRSTLTAKPSSAHRKRPGLSRGRSPRGGFASGSPSDIEALVPDVVAADRGGDIDGINILETAGHDLAEQAAEAYGRIG
jgi:hypothetical protein